ncbi:unnamed protein product [Trichobilharzia szidati]|nr:unnamed protein product [Trichobilharzia szidati]
MVIDTIVMLLVTLTMVVMVNKIKGLCVWITEHSWLTILLILLGALPVLILGLLKLLGYRREIDHFFITFSFILCSMGFTTRKTKRESTTDFHWGLLHCCYGVGYFLDGE